MKKLLVSLTALLCSCAASAQQLKAIDADIQDVINVLETTKHKIYSFDLTPLLDTTYSISYFVKEYSGNEVKKTIADDLGSNKNKFSQAEKLGIYLIPINDSTTKMVMDLQNMTQRSEIFNLQPLPFSAKRRFRFAYESRPFEATDFKPGVEIPLVMYGSFWHDQKFNIYRFCGEKKLATNMSSEMFKNSLHYYVIGIILEKE